MITAPTPVRLSRGKRLALVLGPALFVVLFGVLAYWGALREQGSRQAVDASHRVIETLDRLLLRMSDAEVGARAYLISGQEADLKPYAAAKGDVLRDLPRLRQLTRGNLLEQARLDSLGLLIGAHFGELENSVASRRTQRLDEVLRAVQTEPRVRTMDDARRLAAGIQETERARLTSLNLREEAKSRRLLLILVLGAGGAALVSLVQSRWLDRYALVQQQFAASLEIVNGELQDQQMELELQHEHLQEQAAELENQSVELQAQNDQLQLLTEELEARTEAAESANRAKARFLAAMSHDVRTPLNAITGYLDLLELGIRGPVNEAQLRYLQAIRSSGQRLLALFNDILHFARIEAGRMEVRMEPIPVDDAIRELELSFRPQVEARTLRYTYEGCGPALQVEVDAERLAQIVLNLVTNATKFTEPGGAIMISSIADPGHVTIRVRDTGRGIPAEKLSSIFEPFVQVDRNLTDPGSRGVGLGLAISRELARAMGGDLTVESAPGRGSCFSLVLRRASDVPRRAAPACPTSDDGAVGPPPAEGVSGGGGE